MSKTEDLLRQKTLELQTQCREIWRTREREAVIEIVRAADEAALIVRSVSTDVDIENQQLILKGVAPALATFLPSVKRAGAGLPFGPSTPELATWTDTMLREFGKLAAIHRLAALERYGLSRCIRIDERTIEIELPLDSAEAMDRKAGRWLNAQARRDVRGLPSARLSQKRIVKLLDRTSDVDRGWMIRYDGHKKLIEFYREHAMKEVLSCSESEALPHDSEIGGRTFLEWRAVCAAALGGVLNHIAYATRLLQRHPNLMLRNLLTIPVLRQDAAAVWRQRGESPDRVEATLSHLTIDSDNIVPWQRHHELPTPFYVDVGGGWLLLSLFCGLLNPVCGLVRSLRLRHTKEWDAVVGSRENHYRTDLQTQFPATRFLVPDNGFILRRSDGSQITDIDAIVVDHKTKTLCFFQLKWPDIFGLSPRERESRRLNLLKGNEWVERVVAWIAGRSSADLAKALGIAAECSNRPPLLLVVPRYSVRFTLNDRYDDRAGWVSWPEIVRLRTMEKELADPLMELSIRFQAGGMIVAEQRPADVIYGLKELEVRLRVV